MSGGTQIDELLNDFKNNPFKLLILLTLLQSQTEIAPIPSFRQAGDVAIITESPIIHLSHGLCIRIPLTSSERPSKLFVCRISAACLAGSTVASLISPEVSNSLIPRAASTSSRNVSSLFPEPNARMWAMRCHAR